MSFWTFVFLTVIAGMIYSGWRSKHLPACYEAIDYGQ